MTSWKIRSGASIPFSAYSPRSLNAYASTAARVALETST